MNLKKIDWKELRQQKSLLVSMAAKLRDEDSERVKSARKNEEEVDALDGLINFIDSIQDDAVDKSGLAEKTVFGEVENENCLAGMRCPECGGLGPFEIETATTVTMADTGSLATHDIEFGAFAHISCPRCGHEGKVWQFVR